MCDARVDPLVFELPTTWTGHLLLWAAMAKQALAVSLLRYLLMAVPAFFLCYRLLGHKLARRHIQDAVPSTEQIRRELGWSLSSCVIFAAMDIAVVLLSVTGVMRMRVVEAIPGPVEFFGSVAALIVAHDAYFYWAHRLMHWGPVYRIAHATHHRSTNPTPFAAFAFHPIEAFIQYAFVPLVALVVPVHVMPLTVFGLIMTAMNVYAHLGLELMPAGFARHPVGRFLLTPTHHDLHHTAPGYDFAFYSNVWDRLMGTLNPTYESAFERTTGE